MKKNILKSESKYGVDAGLVKRWGLALNLTFSRFIIFTFINYHFQKKIFFFCHHNFRIKGHSQLSKNEPENIP